MSFEIKKYCYVAKPLDHSGTAEIEYDYSGVTLLFVVASTCDVKNKTICRTVNPGEIICVSGKITVTCNAQTHILGLNIGGIIAEKYAKEVGTAFVTNGIFVPFLPQQIAQVVQNYSNLSEAYLCNISFEILNTLSSSDKKAVIASQTVAEAITLIKQNYKDAYGVEELAAALKISKSHLVREFYKHTGTTPGKYLTNVRIEAVKQLLVQTSLPLSTIAVKTGFSGDNYLCKAFKKVTGETPISYKSRIISSQYLPNQITLQVEPEIYL